MKFDIGSCFYQPLFHPDNLRSGHSLQRALLRILRIYQARAAVYFIVTG